MTFQFTSQVKVEAEKISTEETIDLRSRVLRPGQPLEICQYSEDNLPTTFHLGIRFENKIICNGTFIQQTCEKLSDTALAYRLRGMATDFNFQKKGLGSLVIRSAEEELKRRKSDLLWFNARTSAEIFYQKLGFVALNDIFEITGAGPHKVMYKWLK